MTDDGPARFGETTSTNYLTMLGVPAHSRPHLFSIRHTGRCRRARRAAWRSRFAGDPSIVGRTITARWTAVRSPRRHASWFPRRAAAGFLSDFWVAGRSGALGTDAAGSREDRFTDRRQAQDRRDRRTGTGGDTGRRPANWRWSIPNIGERFAADRSLPCRRHRQIPRHDQDAFAALRVRRPADDRLRSGPACRLREHRRPPPRTRRGTTHERLAFVSRSAPAAAA